MHTELRLRSALLSIAGGEAAACRRRPVRSRVVPPSYGFPCDRDPPRRSVAKCLVEDLVDLRASGSPCSGTLADDSKVVAAYAHACMSPFRHGKEAQRHQRPVGFSKLRIGMVRERCRGCAVRPPDPCFVVFPSDGGSSGHRMSVNLPCAAVKGDDCAGVLRRPSDVSGVPHWDRDFLM